MKKRILPIIIALALCVSAVMLTAVSAEGGAITITFRPDNNVLKGAEFYLYRVAQLNGSDFELTGNFASYPVVLPSDQESGEWMAAAATLAAFAARDGVQEDAHGATNSAGILAFKDLIDGLYLIVGKPITDSNVLYMPQPFLVSVPYVDFDGSLLYNVSVQPKYDYRTLPSEPITRKVVKVWEDNGYETERPQSITVQLLRNGEVYDEQVLSEANNWQYTWTDLDPEYDWKIVEVAISGDYSVLIEEDGVTFTVTNTLDNPPPTTPPVTPTATPSPTPTPTPTPTVPVTPSETPSTPPETPSETPTGSVPPSETPEITPTEPQITPSTEPPDVETPTPGITPTPTPPPDLPHTGMLWWPVPVLLIAGVALLVAGAVIVIFRKGDSTDA